VPNAATAILRHPAPEDEEQRHKVVVAHFADPVWGTRRANSAINRASTRVAV
jgi:hypothetical protein